MSRLGVSQQMRCKVCGKTVERGQEYIEVVCRKVVHYDCLVSFVDESEAESSAYFGGIP